MNLKGYTPWNKGLKGAQKHTAETKRTMSIQRQGENNPNYKGGKIIQQGYIKIWQPKHPYASKTGYVLEHRLVIEKDIDRYLRPEEAVHHINRKRSDNRLENLKLYKNNIEHLLKGHGPNGKWAILYDCCIKCNQTEFEYAGKGLCRKCYRKKYYWDHI